MSAARSGFRSAYMHICFISRCTIRGRHPATGGGLKVFIISWWVSSKFCQSKGSSAFRSQRHVCDRAVSALCRKYTPDASIRELRHGIGMEGMWDMTNRISSGGRNGSSDGRESWWHDISSQAGVCLVPSLEVNNATQIPQKSSRRLKRNQREKNATAQANCCVVTFH